MHLPMEIYVLLPFFCLVVSNQTDLELDQQLYERVIQHLPRHSPPKTLFNNTIYVEFQLHQVLDVDQKNGLWYTRAAFYVWYMSMPVSWDPRDLNGIKHLKLAQNEIWTSDLVIMNAIDIRYITSPDVYILFDGMVVLKSSLVAVKLSCSIDVTHFPFDQQTCYFNIGPVFSPIVLYNLTSSTSEALLGYYFENDQWELVRPVRTFVRSNNLLGTVFSQDFVAEIRLRRRPLYYIIVLICPNLLLYLLSSLVFALPVESGDKITFISTILLAEVVTVSTLNDILPESSLGFPIIAYFVIAIIIHLSILCVCSVIVNKLCLAEKKPSKFIRQLTTWPKLNLIFINPVITTNGEVVNNLQNTQTTSLVENNKDGGANQQETELPDAVSVHTSASCAQLTPSAKVDIEDKINYTKLWKTFAVILDRLFCLVHFLFQTIIILTVSFKI